MTRRQSLLQRPYLHCKHCHETKNVSFSLMAYIFQPYASYTSSISQHPTGLLGLEAKISSRPLLWLRITSWNMLLLGTTTGGNKDWNAVNFTLFLPGKSYEHHLQQHSEIIINSEYLKQNTTPLPSLPPESSQQTAGKERTKNYKKSSANCFSKQRERGIIFIANNIQWNPKSLRHDQNSRILLSG